MGVKDIALQQLNPQNGTPSDADSSRTKPPDTVRKRPGQGLYARTAIYAKMAHEGNGATEPPKRATEPTSLPDIELSWWLGQQRPRVRATHRSLTALYLSEGCYTERDAKLLAMHRLGGTVKAEWYDWQM